jgi:hypothetical protein
MLREAAGNAPEGLFNPAEVTELFTVFSRIQDKPLDRRQNKPGLSVRT